MKKIITLIAIVFNLEAFAQTPINGMVAYYPFSGNSLDSSGNGHNAVGYNGVALTSDRFGHPNSAYLFDGSNDYMKISNASNLRNNYYTYSCWVKATTLPTSGNAKSILELGSGNGGTGSYPFGHGFSINNNSAVGWRVSSTNADSTVVGYQNGTLPNTNVWYHLVVTRNDSIVRTYINKIQIASAVTNGKLPYYANTIDAFIGSRKDLSLAQYFTGALDDIAFFNRVLNSSEINDLYNNNIYSGIDPCINFSANATAPGGTILSSGQYVQLNASSGTSFVWSNGDTSQNILVTQAGNYSVIITNTNGCIDTSNIISVLPIPNNNGLVAYFPFTGNTLDSSGYNNHAVGFNGVSLTSDRFGNANSAYLFDGQNDYMKITNASNFNNNNFTYSFWVKINSLPTNGTADNILELGSGSGGTGTYPYGHGFSINNNYNATTGWRITSTNSDTTSEGYQNGVLPATNTWFNVVVCRNDSIVRTYINAQEIAGAVTNGKLPFYANPIDAYIGSRKDLSLQQFFNGVIDDISIFNRQLSISEINNLYTVGNIVDPCLNFSASITALGSTNLLYGQSVQLNSSMGSSFVWNNGHLTQNISVTQTGNYSVIITDVNGCIDTSNSINVIVSNPNTSSLGLVAYLTFSGNTLDSTVYNNDAVGYNGVTLTSDRFGNPNSAYAFDGVDDYMKITGGTNLNNNNFTYSAWVKINALPLNGNAASILELGSGSGGTGAYPFGHGFSVNNNSNSTTGWRVSSTNSDTTFEGYQNNILPDTNNWYHVVVTRNDSIVRTFINTVEIASQITNGKLPFYANPVDAFIGSRKQLNLPQFFNGILDDIAIYDRELSEMEITDLYTNGIDICSGHVATITSQGSTNLCVGNSLQITSNNSSSYSWSNGDTTQNILVAQSGSYWVALRDSNGCVDSSNVINVIVNSLPVSNIIAQGNTTFCEGESVQLNSDSSSNYAWSTGDNLQNTLVGQSGNYFVVVTDVNGCSDTSNIISVTVNSSPVSNIIAQGNTSFCNGGNVQLISDSSSSYAWNNGDVSQGTLITQSGDYLVVVTDVNGCSDSSNVISVFVNAIPVSNINAQGNTTFCVGESVQLNSDSSSNYAWSNGGNSQSAIVNQAGDYYVVITDANGCSDTSNVISVFVNNNPIVNLGNDLISCSGIINTLDAGTGNSYVWNTTETTQTINVNTSGIYFVNVTDINGCYGTDTVSVNFNMLPTIGGNVAGDAGSISIGIVNLYDVNDATPGASSPVSTVNISNGIYAFNSIPDGQYKILFIPDSATYFPYVLSQYYNNQTIWDSATVVNVVCGQNFVADVVLNTLAPLNGNSVIGGSVIDMGTGKSSALGDPIAGVDVFLRQNSSIVAGTQTDAQGVFRFDHVPAGVFTVLVNMPGLGMLDTYTVILGANDSSLNNDYLVTDSSIVPANTITGIKQTNNVETMTDITVFPNPNNGLFKLEIGMLKEQNVSINIYNAQGALVKNQNLGMLSGKNNRTIDLSNYGSGLYTIQVITDKGFSIKKVIVN